VNPGDVVQVHTNNEQPSRIAILKGFPSRDLSYWEFDFGYVHERIVDAVKLPLNRVKAFYLEKTPEEAE
jgi:hypothetical protein